MSSIFDEAQKLTWSANLSGGDCGHDELVVLTKHLGGATRNIYAVIDRQPPERVGSDGRVTRPKMTVLVRNDATYGYAATEIDPRDTITVAYRFGGTAQAFRISLAPVQMNQDAATLLLELD